MKNPISLFNREENSFLLTHLCNRLITETVPKNVCVGIICDGMAMIADLKEPITLSLSKAACLVLFELLTVSYEQWRKSNPNDDSASPMLVPANEHAERIALWQLEGALERTLPELFASNYPELLRESKTLLEDRA